MTLLQISILLKSYRCRCTNSIRSLIDTGQFMAPTSHVNRPDSYRSGWVYSRAAVSKRYRSGGAKEDRTPDLLRARQALSQLSYGPSIPGSLARSPCFTSSSRGAFIVIGFSVARRFAKVVGLGGFEPPTSPLSGVRSNQLSYRPRLISS